MPYSISWEPHGVTWTYRGVVTGAELLRSNQEIYGDPRFDDLVFQIVDLLDVERFEVSAEDMTIIAATDRAAARSNPAIRIAVVASDQKVWELSDLYANELGGSPWQQRVFESREAARAWIAAG